jgi:hypothetical protein
MHPLPSAAVSAALPRGHAALAFVDVGEAFAYRAAVVVSVGFSEDLWGLHISIYVTPKTMSTYRGWTQVEYQNKRYNINQKDEGT